MIVLTLAFYFAFGVLCLWLMTKRWFWVLLFSLGTLACFFSVVASVIHFQILGAMGYFFLMGVCAVIAVVIFIFR